MHIPPRLSQPVHPAVREIERSERSFLSRKLAGKPESIRVELVRMRDRIWRQRNYGRANRELVDWLERYRQPLAENASDEGLNEHARAYARACSKTIIRASGWSEAYDRAAAYCRGLGVEPPEIREPITVQSAIARMRCERWWRRKIRTTHARIIERQARALGMVSKRRGLYLSDPSFQRWMQRQRRSAIALSLASLECVDTGEEISLEEAASAGPQNPAIRRMELMTRIRGTEEYAQAQGHVALFVTWTLPPELHAVHSKSGHLLGGNEVDPRQGQAWFTSRWAKLKARLHRLGIEYYGLRVVEPHHDGTPHWHMLLFTPESAADDLSAELRDAVVDQGDSRARSLRACRVVRIDPARGTAAGYCAKYVAKGVDGRGIADIETSDSDGDRETLDADASEAALRARAWASLWGIRQFQFLGLPAVTIWRGLRRLDAIAYCRPAELLRQAADRGEWRQYLQRMGGPSLPPRDRPAVLRAMPDAGETAYGEPREKAYIEIEGRPFVFAPWRWVIRYGAKRLAGKGIGRQRAGNAGAPWTCGNNCTRPEPINPAQHVQPESGRGLRGPPAGLH